MACLDHPQEQARCFVSGTGLTHQASAANRNAMHESDTPVEMTDSMQVFQWGIEGGKPAPGTVDQCQPGRPLADTLGFLAVGCQACREQSDFHQWIILPGNFFLPG